MKKMIPLVEKYRASKFSDLKGLDSVILEVEDFYKKYPIKGALILNGAVGTGKTSLAIALANEYNLELFELNASDLRNKSSLDEVLRPSVEQQSLFKKGKLILMDEADGITGSDRGGVSELINLIDKSNFPIVITANDIWGKKFSGLRKKCKIVSLKELEDDVVKEILLNIVNKENGNVKGESIDLIVKQARGDVRAAINDLQSIFGMGEDAFLEEISEREKQDSIFNSLKKVFQDKTDEKTIRVFDSTDIQLDEILLWVEENIPQEYQGKALVKAYDFLSRADIFKGRIYRQQYWRFLVYESFFLSAGISSCTMLKTKKFVQYKRPSRILKIWMANLRNAKIKSVVGKYAKFVHMSKKKANRDRYLLPLILDGLDERTKRKLDLDETEINYLKEKKVDLIVSKGLNRFRG